MISRVPLPPGPLARSPKSRIAGLLPLLAFVFCWIHPPIAHAVRPLSSFSIALVAGEGPAGLRDGSFTRARFKTPLGLAIDPHGTRLYVADSGNHLIRVVNLDQDNSVTTLAGKGTAGHEDGSFALAGFNQPRGVVYLPGERLVVNDYGNKSLRLLDLKSGEVTTLGGGSLAQQEVGPAAEVSMEGIRDMVYWPAADSLFFTQPEKSALKKLDLKTGQVALVPGPVPGLAHPAALCAAAGKLYVADRDLPQVFQLEWTKGTLSSPTVAVTLAAGVLSLAQSGGYLYALQADPNFPLQRLLPKNQPVTFLTVWGDIIPQPGKNTFPFAHLDSASPVGFISDPSEERKFYFVNPQLNMVTSYRDLWGNDFTGGDTRNSNGVNEPEYPAQKPFRTFRILFVGDSRCTMMVPNDFPTDFHVNQGNFPFPRILGISKKMELELNTLAALENQPLNFEVFCLSHAGGLPLFLWPTFEVPDVVKRNDIDLVVIMQPPTIDDLHPLYPYRVYFTNPITRDGIPQYPFNMEYFLKPPLERIRPGVSRKFYDLCRAEHLVKIEEGKFIFDDSLLQKPEFHDLLVRMYGKPLDLLNQKVLSMRTAAGQAVRLLLCSIHTGVFRPNNTEDPAIWADVAREFHIPFLDQNDEMTALQLTYYPLAARGDNNHFNPDGQTFYGQLMAHDLIRNGFIPWTMPSTNR